jgi:diguanylate cyclase (GGDEF)-like protein
MVYNAEHDVLTGLANRAIFTATLERAIARSHRSRKKGAILHLDLGRFKDVNDTRGRLTGDQLLRLVAKRLRGGVRRGATMARFGADEFAILLEDLCDPAEIAALANRLIGSISHPYLGPQFSDPVMSARGQDRQNSL